MKSKQADNIQTFKLPLNIANTDSQVSIDPFSTRFLAHTNQRTNGRILSDDLRLLESKKNMVALCMDLISILIIFISLMYFENENSFYINERVRVHTLACITALTIVYSTLKAVKCCYYQKILINTRFLNRDSPLLTQRIFTTMLIYLVHPNYLFNALSFTSTMSFPERIFQRPVNLYLLVFQLTVIFSELLRRLTIVSYISEENKLLIRKHRASKTCFYFAVKYLFKERPFYVLYSYLTCCTVYLSLLLKLFESPRELRDEAELYYWPNAIWTSFVTMLTIGYGDCYPVTYAGRIVSIATGIFGCITFSLIVIAINDSIRFNPCEHKTYLFIEKKRLKIKMRQRAANVIVLLLKCYLSYKKDSMNRYRYYRMRLDDALLDFKRIKQQFVTKNQLKNLHRSPTHCFELVV